MKHLVIFVTENGISSAVYNFKNTPPTVEDIKEMQKGMQKTEDLIQMPAIVNWLPISDQNLTKRIRYVEKMENCYGI